MNQATAEKELELLSPVAQEVAKNLETEMDSLKSEVKELASQMMNQVVAETAASVGALAATPAPIWQFPAPLYPKQPRKSRDTRRSRTRSRSRSNAIARSRSKTRTRSKSRKSSQSRSRRSRSRKQQGGSQAGGWRWLGWFRPAVTQTPTVSTPPEEVIIPDEQADALIKNASPDMKGRLYMFRYILGKILRSRLLSVTFSAYAGANTIPFITNDTVVTELRRYIYNLIWANSGLLTALKSTDLINSGVLAHQALYMLAVMFLARTIAEHGTNMIAKVAEITRLIPKNGGSW